MKNQNKARVNDLCEKLDMDFNEAAEIFSSETLDGMKMARICGAGDYWGEYTNSGNYSGINAYALGGRDTGSGLVGFSSLLVNVGGTWLLDGKFVKDVEVGHGTFTYSYVDTTSESFDPTSFCMPWDDILTVVGGGTSSWLQ